MKKLILILSVLICLTGCFSMDFDSPFGRKELPKGNETTVQTQEQRKTKTRTDISGDISIDPLEMPELNPTPPVTLDIFDQKISIPRNSKVNLKVGTKEDEKSYAFMEIFSEYKKNSGPFQLFIFGGILVAIGIALTYFGLWKIGIGTAIAGFSLIGCGVLINTYPWIILIALLVLLGVGAYFVYLKIQSIKKEKENADQLETLKELTNQIGKLPEEELEKIKGALKDSDISSTIRKVTRKVMGKTEE